MTTFELATEHDRTVIGSAENLLRVLREGDNPEEVAEAAHQLEQAIAGPDWTTMAMGLLGVSPLVNVVEDVIWKKDLAPPLDQMLVDDLGAGLSAEDVYRGAVIDRMAAGMAAAHEDGRMARSIEGMRRLPLTKDTVLCFTIPPTMPMRAIEDYRKSLDKLGRRIEATMGFKPVMVLIPEGSEPMAFQGEPETVKTVVNVVQPEGQWTLTFELSPKGWRMADIEAPPDHSVDDFSIEHMMAVKAAGVKLAEQGHGRRA